MRNPCAQTCVGRLDVAGHQHRRPIDRVEPEDVLADRVDVRRPHPREPLGSVGVAGRGDVVRQRVEPDVADVLRVPRDRHAPVERRPADREVLKTPADRGQDLVAAGLGLDRLGMRLVVLEEAVRVGREAEEVVLLDHPLDRPLVDRAEPVDQLLLGVVGLARHAVQALVRPEVDVVPAVVVDGVQELHDRSRVAGLGGPDVVVVRDVKPGPDLAPTRLHRVDPLLRRHALLLGRPLELQAVLVGAGEVEDLLTAQPVEPGDEVGGHGVVRVPDVGHVVRVVDRGGDVEDVAAHGRVMVPAAGVSTDARYGVQC